MNTVLKGVWAFFLNEVRTEWRQRYAVNGILLFVVATVFIVFFSFEFIDELAWNALFWIIMVFAAINAVSRSFIQDSRGRALLHYSMMSPMTLIFARMLYNFIFLLLLSVFCLIVFTVFISDPVSNRSYFLLVCLIGSGGLGATFTMVSAIASKARNSTALMPVLGFPVILPQLMLLVNQTKSAISGVITTNVIHELYGLSAIILLVIVVSYLLFPYLWRE